MAALLVCVMYPAPLLGGPGPGDILQGGRGTGTQLYRVIVLAAACI